MSRLLLSGGQWSGTELDTSARSFFTFDGVEIEIRHDVDQRIVWLRVAVSPPEPTFVPRPPSKYVATGELRQGARVYRAEAV